MIVTSLNNLYVSLIICLMTFIGLNKKYDYCKSIIRPAIDIIDSLKQK